MRLDLPNYHSQHISVDFGDIDWHDHESLRLCRMPDGRRHTDDGLPGSLKMPATGWLSAERYALLHK